MAELGVGVPPNVACEFKRAGFLEGGMTAMRTSQMPRTGWGLYTNMNILAKFDLPQRIIWGGYFLLVFTVIVAGDSLYTLYLYPIIGPIVVLEICSWRQVRSFYLCGVAAVLYLTLFCYLSMNWFSAKPEGLLVLGHIFSLPGLVVGAIAFARRDRPNYGPAASAFLGAMGAGIGFLLGQGLVCNTVMHCGAFSVGF